MHMGLVQFNSMVGAVLRSSTRGGPALNSLLGGGNPVAIISMPTVVTQIQSGKLRASR